MPPALSALVILVMGSCFLLRPSWTMILFYASHYSWDDRHAPTYPAFFSQDGVSEAFLPQLTWNHDPPNLSLPSS
jgi:hypothetical protein